MKVVCKFSDGRVTVTGLVTCAHTLFAVLIHYLHFAFLLRSPPSLTLSWSLTWQHRFLSAWVLLPLR